MFDWFQRHKWLGLILMSLLLVTMGASVAMIDTLTNVTQGSTAKGDSFRACDRTFTNAEVEEIKGITDLCSRISGAPSIVSLDREAGALSDRETAVRLILVELAQRSGISVAEADVDEIINRILESNKRGLESNLLYAGRTMADVRRYFHQELLISRYIGYTLAGVTATTEEAYKELSENESGGKKFAWVESDFATERAKTVLELDQEMGEYYTQNKSLFRSPYVLGGEWILARVKADTSDEAIAAEHAASVDPAIKDKPLPEVRALLVAALEQKARDRADAAIQAVGAVMQEENMASASIAEIRERVRERTEGIYEDLLEDGATVGLVESQNLPAELIAANFAGQARTVAASGGLLTKLIGREGNFADTSFFMTARTLGREDSRQMTFEDVRAGGYEKALQVFYEMSTARYTAREIRIADIAVADFERFATEGKVSDAEIQAFFDMNRVQLFTTDGKMKELAEVRDQIVSILRRRDAVPHARDALELLTPRLETLGRSNSLLEITAGTTLTVLRVPVTEGDYTLSKSPGLESIPKDYRSRVYSAVFNLSAADVEAGKISALIDTPTASYVAKVVERQPGTKAELDTVRARLLDDFIDTRAFDRFSERTNSLRERMSVIVPGADDSEKWNDEEKAKWQHHNRTRFDRVATDEGLSVKTTEGFIGDDDPMTGELAEVENFSRMRRNIGLDSVVVHPPLALQITDATFKPVVNLITVAETLPLDPAKINADQIDRGRRTLLSKKQLEVRDDMIRLTWLKTQKGVNFEAISKEMLGIDFKEEETE